MGKHHIRCIACRNERDDKPELRFFGVPRGFIRKEIWLRNLCRMDLLNIDISKDLRVCEEHFDQKLLAKTDRRLKKHIAPMPKEIKKEKPDIEFINLESRNASADNEQHQQNFHQRKSQESSSSSSSLTGIPGNFCEVEIKSAPSVHKLPISIYDNIRKAQLSVSTSSGNRGGGPLIIQKKKITPMRPYPQVNVQPTTSRNINVENESNLENQNKHVKSKDLLTAAYDLLQMDTNKEKKDDDNDENNLKSFGEFIDAELEKLDENSVAIVKMKINEILHEASSGMYKNAKANKNINEVQESSVVNDNVMEKPSESRKRPRENSPEKDKENQLPSVLEKSNSKADNDKSLDSQQANVCRKKRLKSKELLSAVYNVLNKESLSQSHISFGAYVCTELKTMDNETVRNVKLDICRVIYEASKGKCKNLPEKSTTEQQNIQTEDTERRTSTDTDIVIITPKQEPIDPSYEMQNINEF